MSEKFLKVEDLVVEYRTGGKVVHAVNNVSFELERGKTLGLVGETGAGKTTIAKTILRVLPDAQAKVKSGKVILDGEDLLSLSEAAMRKVRGGQVTMVFQDPMTALNPIMKVGEQIAEVIRKHQTREDKDGNSYDLQGILVNLRDYNVGADKLGEINTFEQFDIDYNQQKYLMETRCSGAMTVPYGAIVYEVKTPKAEVNGIAG